MKKYLPLGLDHLEIYVIVDNYIDDSLLWSPGVKRYTLGKNGKLPYPNNPTSAVADMDFFRRVVDFAQQHQIIICHDAAYSELALDGYQPISFLEVPGAKEHKR